MQRLPFFYHIPKNAGTYFVSYSVTFGRFYVVDNIGVPPRKWLRNIEIKRRNAICARLIAIDTKSDFCQKNKKIKKPRSPDPTYYQIAYDDFKNDSLEGLQPLVFIVEGSGFDLRDAFLDRMKDYCPFECLIDREPISRQKSLYRYLTSQESAHEKTHKNFTNSLSFDNYIRHHINEEDCWLIRAFLQKRYPEKINMDDFNAVCEILDGCYIKDISETDEFIRTVFRKCHGDEVEKLMKKQGRRAEFNNLNKNASSSKKPIENYNEEELKAKLHWANKLYEKYRAQ
jgi:hypothetical protein